MQIEEGFRDMKSRLYGLDFEQNKSTLKRRLTILILIATLASLVLMLVGLVLKSAALHLRYQAVFAFIQYYSTTIMSDVILHYR
jgi:hypothetical protein